MGAHELSAGATSPRESTRESTRERAPRVAETPVRETTRRSETSLRPGMYALALMAVDAGALAWPAVASGAARPARLAVAAAVVVALHASSGLYRLRRGFSPAQDAPRLAVGGVVAALILSATAESWRAAAGYLVLAITGRLAAYGAVRWARLRGRRCPALVVGGGAAGLGLAAVLRRRPEYGLDPVGIVLAGPWEPRGAAVPVPVLGGGPELRRVMRRHDVRAVFVVLPELRHGRLETIVEDCDALGAELFLVPSSMAVGAVDGRRTECFGGVVCVAARLRPHTFTARWGKRLFDLAVALGALAVTWPLFLACAVAVRLESGPGVLFRQLRVGLDGRTFVLLKFRTMHPATEEEADTRWSIEGDERVGRVGRLLRRTWLDELPQLWNVVRGDMSVVGPRPERPYFVRRFSRTVPGYALRHRVPVGITGWAQVHGLHGDTCVEERARFDNQYIAAWTLWTDVRILLLTARAMLLRAVP
ncbi:sugar transferase [Thermomonospora umbrina]|uniref:Exopolysaccharide biosynthesis polyprenyl glycosylphosphotransferase n=1 Tax=Thermomonospora umbrina TaxID=111806 RepID=A0A3D9SP06_9ACTN|nr:sugar transferase [Thermomonospora umbrina]REE97706.1 exopolysaccharide biosynthesis polyprenyl glycosylphosphotransferase [Thermomonospora umbrina]